MQYTSSSWLGLGYLQYSRPNIHCKYTDLNILDDFTVYLGQVIAGGQCQKMGPNLKLIKSI